MPNGDLISASSDRTIKVWDLTQGLVKRTLFGHTNAVTSLLLLETGDLISGGLDGIKIWDTDNWRLKKNLTDSEIHMNLLANIGNGLIAGGAYGEINVWNFTDGSIVRTFTYIDLYLYNNLIGLTQSHKLIATGPNLSCQTFLWDAKSDKIDYVSELINSPDYYSSYCISAFSYLRDGNLAVGFDDGLIELWNFKEEGSYKVEHRLAGHSKPILSITELENGKLASCSPDGNIFVWKF
jgi:WD40 repeat protein